MQFTANPKSTMSKRQPIKVRQGNPCQHPADNMVQRLVSSVKSTGKHNVNPASIVDIVLFCFIVVLVMSSIVSLYEYRREQVMRLVLSSELAAASRTTTHLRVENAHLSDELRVYQETDDSIYEQTGESLAEFGGDKVLKRINALENENRKAHQMEESLKIENTLLRSHKGVGDIRHQKNVNVMGGFKPMPDVRRSTRHDDEVSSPSEAFKNVRREKRHVDESKSGDIL